MALRVIVRTASAVMAVNVGGPVQVTYRTFEIDAPAVEAFLGEDLGTYSERDVVGVEFAKPRAEGTES